MNMHRLLVYLFLLLPAIQLNAQEITVNRSLLEKPSGYGVAAKALAIQLLSASKAPSTVDDYDRLFRLELCAGQYAKAVQDLRMLRKMQPDQDWEGLPAIGIQFELMGMAYPGLSAAVKDTEAVVLHAVEVLYKQLPDAAKPFVEQYFRPDIESLRNRFEQVRQSMLQSPHGKVASEDAVKYCRLFLSLEIARTMNSAALQFLLSEDDRKYIIEDSLQIHGADSAVLTAVVVRKRDQTEPQPVILVYSIYAGSGDLRIAKAAADHGYVGVVVNTRGKGLSLSDVEPFEHDAADSWFVIDELSKQEYCDGRVGMYGGSYLGFSQWSALKNPHPALKTIIPQVAVAPGIDFPGTGGVRSTYMYQWLRYVANTKYCDQLTFNNTALWDSLNNKLYDSGLPFIAFDSLAGKPDSVFRRWLVHSTYDTYWQRMIPYRDEFAVIQIPVLTITGYFDDDQSGALYYWYNHHQYNPAAQHYLLVGPWDHFGAQSSPAESLRGYTIDSTGKVSIDQLVFEWMDFVFREKPLPALLHDKVNLQVMGTNTWWSGKSLSSGLKDSLQLYLSEKEPGKGRLVETMPAVSRRIQLSREPQDQPLEAAAYDSPVALADTSLPTVSGIWFTSEALNDTSYMHGCYNLALRFIPDCQDADLITRLYEKTADGNYYLLGTGLQRISAAPGSSSPQYLVPGELAEVKLRSDYFTERCLLPGSRLLLWADIHAARGYEFNTGTAIPVQLQERSAFKGIHLLLIGESKLSIPLRRK